MIECNHYLASLLIKAGHSSLQIAADVPLWLPERSDNVWAMFCPLFDTKAMHRAWHLVMSDARWDVNRWSIGKDVHGAYWASVEAYVGGKCLHIHVPRIDDNHRQIDENYPTELAARVALMIAALETLARQEK